jgi:transcriptional regulator with XRE-family HTH domain
MNNIKRIREKRNVTQVRLSTAVDVAQETISAYESGKSMPSADTLIRIADFLNTSTDYLLGRINDDVSLNQIISKEIDEKIATLLNNYAKLSEKQRNDLIWYSEVLIDKKV